MPALKPSPPLDAATLPPSRRRVWKHPELTSHSLLVLTFDEIRLAPLAGVPRPEVVAAAELGADLDDLLGPLATAVPLAAVRRARLDLLTNSLVLEYTTGRSTSRLVVAFATTDAADACFTKVWRRLGDRFQLQPFKRSPWSASRSPLVMLAAVLALTGAIAGTLGMIEEYVAARSTGAVSVTPAGELGTPVTIHKTSLERLPDLLNWRVVCGIGGAAAAGLQVWLYRRLTQPPLSLELTLS